MMQSLRDVFALLFLFVHISDRPFFVGIGIRTAVPADGHFSLANMFAARLSRTDQAFLIKADQVFPSAFYKRFPDQFIVIGISVLNQRPLHRDRKSVV